MINIFYPQTDKVIKKSFFLLPLYFISLFSFILFINIFYLEGIPHVPDDVAYIFMAKMFLSGHIVTNIPVSPEHFNFFPGILSIQEGQWLFQYPFGHPLLLSIGMFIGYPQIIPAFVGSLGIFVLYLTTRNVYGNLTGGFLLPLPFISPFFLSNAASYMSHNTSFLYLVCALFFLIKTIKKTTSQSSFFVGTFLGLLFNTRPLTALPFIAIFGVIIYIKTHKKSRLRSVIMFCLGLALFVTLWLLYNLATTNFIFSSQYLLVNKHLFMSSSELNFIQVLNERFNNVRILFHNFGPTLFNWPVLITHCVLIIPYILRKHSFYDTFFFLCLFSLPFAYFFYNGTFLMYGPRFWYEIIPFFFLLTARSIYLLYENNKVIIFFGYTVLILLSLARLLSFLPTERPDYFSPVQITSLKSFNFVDNRIPSLIQKHNINNAVIFVEECSGNWWCYGSVFAKNNPTLTTDIVYAKDLGDEKNTILYNYFPNKRLYRVSYDSLRLAEIYR